MKTRGKIFPRFHTIKTVKVLRLRRDFYKSFINEATGCNVGRVTLGGDCEVQSRTRFFSLPLHGVT